MGKTCKYVIVFGLVFSLAFYATIGIINYNMKSASSQSLTKSDLQTVKKTNLTSLSSTLTTKSSDQKLELSALKNKEKTSNVHHKNSLEEKNTSNLSLPQVLIYHSHNRESWIPELKNIKVANEAFDSKTNVTLLGDYLIKKMKTYDIPVFHSKKDYPSVISNFNYAYSYTYSRETIEQERAMHNNIEYLIDIHRDSQGRDKTTIQYNNLNYAQVYFVVGTNNPNWQKNLKFAERIQKGLNSKVPSLSKGIYKKDSSIGNGDYNQALSANSALIEIGGVENNLEENYRTITLLAKVMREIWLEDNKLY
ncbi:stage II sporulation protein P [Paenibacillus sp. PDC88]|uniref:Stage II sporulation protein P n=1 Tax=Paenibacillus provencensis TaxID=441151 RepID=A0ABW3QF01_9BACL|nr:stage II sporulation protein P [Paenibacillus sp. PDC88]SDX61839.1 stage II sporulation protein P [Paenibacillus sp. PDC88]